MKIIKIDVVSESPAPPQPKTMSETKYLDSKDSHEKIDNFFKKYFFAVFSQTFDISKSKFSSSDRSGDVAHLGIAGSTTLQDLPDLENLDFKISKLLENIAKNYFLKKYRFFHGNLLSLDTSFLT